MTNDPRDTSHDDREQGSPDADEHVDDSPSTDVDETSEQSFPTSDPPSTWSSAGQDDT